TFLTRERFIFVSDAANYFAGDFGDVNSGPAVLRLDVDGEHVFLVGGNDGIVVAGRRDHVGVWNLRLIELGDGAGRIVALKIRRGGVHVAHGHVGRSAFDHLRAGIHVNPEVASGFIGIRTGVHGPKRRFHAHIAVLIVDPAVAGDAVSKER